MNNSIYWFIDQKNINIKSSRRKIKKLVVNYLVLYLFAFYFIKLNKLKNEYKLYKIIIFIQYLKYKRFKLF